MLDCAKQFDVKQFVFSSSCSVYGNVASLPVTESTPLAKPECPYAATKQMGEQMLLDMAKVMQTNMVLLRYFNPVGAHASAQLGEIPFGRPNNLVPVITQTAIGLQENMLVWGADYDTRDGSCIRDYIHVMDIAHAHTLAIDYLIKGAQQQQVEIFNVGSGNGVSVLEAIKAFEKVSGTSLNYTIGPRREGDVVAIYADNSLIRSRLGWQPSRSLDEMMLSAWVWQQKLAQRPLHKP
jgi:UDP-glucose 4-epimerase